MTRDAVWALVAAYLWIQGGLGWAAQHEASKHATLTPTGRGLIVVLSPFLSFLGLVGMTIERIRYYIVDPLRTHLRSNGK